MSELHPLVGLVVFVIVLGSYAVASGWLVDALGRRNVSQSAAAGTVMVLVGGCLTFLLLS